MTPVRTRFAPSPTGFLHIGGARTALFNWLFARHHGGTFHLRIEDTDRARSTQAAIDAILEGMQWLGLKWDGEVIYQFARAARHREVVQQLLAQGKAYHCYCTPEELQQMRDEAMRDGRPALYDRRWRDRDPASAPRDMAPVVRIKAPLEGKITVEDAVQGTVSVDCAQLDDMVLLRSDGTPTYLLAVVVDDVDMGITHVIRGDDHFTNTFRQRLIYDAMGWAAPTFAHIPLIHGADGAKLSKRHGALGVDAYRDMGFLPQALSNYLLRLGWGHGDAEVISQAQAIEWFTLEGVGKSPSRFDMAKLQHLNGVYLKAAPSDELAPLLLPFLAHTEPLSSAANQRLLAGLESMKTRAKTLIEMAEIAPIFIQQAPILLEEAASAFIVQQPKEIYADCASALEAVAEWSKPLVEAALKHVAEQQGRKFGEIAQALRAALTGRMASPGALDVALALGKEETLGRIRQFC